ncbi:collagenase [Rheinheimera sp.]|uniref:collagenase n=1 Tax=Rheinheimera sp. TaxID=1869214 RepID=UPI0027B92C5B|nr:collagenase [Rheinheimera sp.]
MKSHLKLLPLLLSSGLVMAQDQVQLTHPGQISLDLQRQHLTERLSQQNHMPESGAVVAPPRLMSPAEFEKVQAKIYAEKHGLELSTRWRPAADQEFYLADKKSFSTVATQKYNNAATQAAAGCTSPADLLNLYGNDLVHAVSNASLTGCLYKLYDASLVGSAHFSDSKILTIATAINEKLVGFDGSDASGAVVLEKLVTYLRAMHWAESSTGRTFAANYKTMLQQAFDQYFAGEHFVNFTGTNSRNYFLRYEMLILVRSSATDALQFLPRFSEALQGYASTVNRNNDWGIAYEENGMTQILTHYFNAVNMGGVALEQTLAAHPQIVTRLRDFVLNDGQWLLGHTREYQLNDAVTELGRLLKLGGTVADTVRPAMQYILSNYSYGGIGSQAWVNAQGMVKTYDSANCAQYGNACQFDLESTVLSGSHQCGPTLKLRFQGQISAVNLAGICQKLAAEETLFHQTFATQANKPVANDNNSALEMVIFKSSTDYQNYAGQFFGIDTNNGGMYLEGTPSDPDNQARFIAYQATWLLPSFVVWNLEHEYIHYLDGRFNQWGSFSDQPENSVWWGEGLAEYLSQPTNNVKALAAAPNKNYQLSELFQTTYANSNTARTYHWGYLAVRFMFERHRADIDQPLLPTLRAAKYAISTEACSFDWGWRYKPDAIANNWSWLYDDSAWGSGNWVWTCGQPKVDLPELPVYTPYQDILSTWGTNFDIEFHQWLDCVVAGQGICQQNPFRAADLDKNGAVDKRDVELFNQRLRSKTDLTPDLDFNLDKRVDQRDVPAMTKLCDLPRCAIAA